MTELALPAPPTPAYVETAAVPAADAGAPLPEERSDRELLADVFRRPRVWGLLAAYHALLHLVLCAGIYFRLEARGTPIPFLRLLAEGVPEGLTLILGQALAFAVGWFFPPRGRHWALRLAAAAVMLACVLVGRQFLLNAVLIVTADAPWDPFRGTAPWMPGNVLLLTLYAAVGASIRAVMRERERRLAVARLEERVGRERFRALKMQIRPRFLFDTLSAVGERMHHDVPTAERLLVRTGELLRLTFRHAGADRVPLQQELSFAILYLEIEGARAGRPVGLRATADREAREAQVPHMSVFPLVESAVLSGAERGGPSVVEVEARREGDRLRVDVRDDLCVPLAARRRAAGWEPVEALRARLAELPGGDFHLAFEDLPAGGVRASLSVPLAAGAA